MNNAMHGKSYISGHLLGIARNAYKSLTPTMAEAQVVIAFSAMALEAFLNEIEDLSAQDLMAENDRLRALGQILATAEASRASAIFKIELSHVLLTGKTIDRGAHPYQDLGLLFKLRNLIVHPRPESVILNPEPDESHPNIVSSLAARGIIEPPASGAAIAWRQYVFVPTVAAWAHNVAVGTISWFVDLLPDGHLKTIVTFMIRDQSVIGT
jgi:hypothetical protein